MHVQPGTSFTYRVEIPAGHDAGLFWYHSHAHGRSSPQIIGGLSGGLIVEGSERFYPFLKALRERVLLLKHLPDPRPDWQELVTLNGVVAPTIPIRPGEAQYWRIGNIGADLFLKLTIEGLPLYVVATDGHSLRRPSRRDEVLLGPGSRIEAVVIGGPPGRYVFKSVSFPLEQVSRRSPSAIQASSCQRVRPRTPPGWRSQVMAQTVNLPRYIDAVRSSPIARRRTMTFSRTADKTRFFINGQVFDENRTDATVTLGDTEEWTIRNEDNQLHNFHIHQTEFLVTAIGGVPQTFDSLYDTFSLRRRRTAGRVRSPWSSPSPTRPSWAASSSTATS